MEGSAIVRGTKQINWIKKLVASWGVSLRSTEETQLDLGSVKYFMSR